MMNSLLEHHHAPQLPELMMIDDECSSDHASVDSWMVGLALCAGNSSPSAPVPIASRARAQRMSPGSDLVDSLESTQTMLGASLRQDAAAAAHQQLLVEQSAMRFVPVADKPAAGRQFATTLTQQLQQQQQQLWAEPSSLDDDLYHSGFGAVAASQPRATSPLFRPPQEAGWQFQASPQLASTYDSGSSFSAATWDVPPATLPLHAPPPPHQLHAGISSLDIPYGYVAEFGAQAPLPCLLRRAVSDNVLDHSVHQQHHYDTGLLASVAEGGVGEDSVGSQGSEGDTVGGYQHPQHASQQPLGLPVSHSAPNVSLLGLERSNSTVRSQLHAAAGSRGGHSAASPRKLSLKLKSQRSRQPAGPRASASAAPAHASHRPARLAARRSVVLAAATSSDDDEEYAPASESDMSEAEISGVAGEVRRSSGGSPALRHESSTGKKKHNPWSLNETEALVEGVRLLGPSKWAEIKKLTVSGICSLLTNRSAVDLKDKWRNLTRVARLSKVVLKSRSHKSTSDIPLELLLTVKELMELAKVEAE